MRGREREGEQEKQSEVERTCLLASCLDTLHFHRLNIDNKHFLFYAVNLGFCLSFAYVFRFVDPAAADVYYLLFRLLLMTNICLCL